ncbi:MAG: glycosyltransferase [Clostridium sp.]|uniref:glycosyltransferase n=1 Tax=Clostridium sp. TaxID=1506 RepID=UPI0039EA0461
MNGEKSISFIIVNYNGKHHLKECFSTLNKLNYPKDKIEYIMVDNGSKDGSVQFVKSKFKNVKIIQNKSNEGFAKPNNDAAKIAKGDYIALINNDMKIDANWLNDMVETLDSCNDDSYVCVGSKILNWDGSKLDFAGGSINFYGHGYQYDFGIEIDEANKRYNEDKDILFACGGAMLIDRNIYLEIGGLDEDYFAYFEDVDLGWRLWVLGYKVRFCSKAICYHKHNSTSKKMNRNKVMRMFERNSLFTIYKNYEEKRVYEILTGALLMKNYKQYTERGISDEDNPDVLGIMDFSTNLPLMKEKRDYIQRNRKKSDDEIIKLFIDSPYKNLITAEKNNKYNNLISNITNSMGLQNYFGSQKLELLIICTDNIAAKMAGPGIRYFEIAKQLSHICNVTLAIPNKTDLDEDTLGFKFFRYNVERPQALINKFYESDIILLHGMILEKVVTLKSMCKDKIVIVDLYDPYTIENLEIHKNKSLKIRSEIHESDLNTLNNQLVLGDYFICANEKQKDFWIGMLSSLNKVNPVEYKMSNKLERLIGLVPFGISTEDPVHTRKGALIEKIPNLEESDKVFIWGGGVWNWFDPLSLIKAIYSISKERKDIKLLFLGVKHPNPEIPEMEMTSNAIKLAEEFGIKDELVFFNMDWVEYSDRQNFLLESYAGVSCHFDNLETRFSFRTRILDYLWSNLPIISTEGDYFADDIEKYGLGLVVKYNDDKSIKDAIIKMVDDNTFYEETKNNIRKYREKYKWDIVTEPLKQFCLDPVKKQDDDISNADTYNYITDINQISKQEIVGAIMSNFKIGQKFRCRYPNLTSIELMFGTYSRSNEHVVKFKLFDAFTDDLIVEKDIDASILVDNGWFEITFKPIINSEGRTFYFYFESEEATPSNCITLFKDEAISDCGEIWNNGVTVEGSLTMKTKCIISDRPISEKKGIKLDDSYYAQAGTKVFDKNELNGSRSEIGNINALNKELSEIKKSMSYLSKNVSELNIWKSKLSGRLGFIRNIGFFKK